MCYAYGRQSSEKDTSDYKKMAPCHAPDYIRLMAQKRRIIKAFLGIAIGI
jgi:hypothetical protein